MKKYDLLVRNGFVVTPNACKKGDVAISSGKIAAIHYGNSTNLNANKELDVLGKYILPGAIDTHTHFFEPGSTYREGFYFGSKAAASGGYTTIMEMPNTDPAVTDKESFFTKYELAKRNCCVDFMIWGAAMPGNLHNLKSLFNLGCPAFKAFTLDAGPAFEYSNPAYIYLGMNEVKEIGGIYGVHAEDNSIIAYFKKKYEMEKWTPRIHEKSRPYYSELVALSLVLAIAKETECPLHICHMSIPEGADLIKLAKTAGVDVTTETTPHYLTLNIEKIKNNGSYSMVCPPIRSKERMEKLWEYIIDGTIDYIGTDHAPYTVDDKEPVSGNMWHAEPGMPSIDIAVPLLLSYGVNKRNIPITKMSCLLATNAAKRFGIYPQKGVITVGADADLIIVDMNKNWKYSRANSFSRTKVTKFPYENIKLSSYIERTIIRGKIVYELGKITGEAGFGQLVKTTF